MKRIPQFLLWLALAVGLTSPAFAQSVVQDDVSGNETWSAGQGPGGPSGFITTSLTRNSANSVATTVTGATTIGVTTGFTNLRWGGYLLVTAQPSAAVITLPPNPVQNGAIFAYCNVSSGNYSSSAVTFAANTGQSLPVAVTVTTQAASSCTYVMFNRSNTTWYRIS